MPQIKETTIELSGIHSFSVSKPTVVEYGKGKTRININGTGIRIVKEITVEGDDFDALCSDPEAFVKDMYGFEDPPAPDTKTESKVTVKDNA